MNIETVLILEKLFPGIKKDQIEKFDNLQEFEQLSVECLADVYGYDFERAIEALENDYPQLFDGTSVEYAEELIDDCYDLEKTMGNLASYFDYEKFARDLILGGDIAYWESQITEARYVITNCYCI